MRRTRLERASELGRAEAARQSGVSQRQAALRLGIPRSSLQEWRGQTPTAPAPAVLAALAQTPEGVAWLHRLVAAAHFAIGPLAGGGVRIVCDFLRLSGLDAVVGASYGIRQRVAAALEDAAGEYAREQRGRLAADMPRRRISVCEDETYHPQIRLVALEPVSGYIVEERYAQDRTAATWTRAIETALEGLPAEAIQGTSDEAKGLLRHVQRDLGAHRSPDLFHVQYEVSRATGPIWRCLSRAGRRGCGTGASPGPGRARGAGALRGPSAAPARASPGVRAPDRSGLG